jgi:transcriptional regulator with XRE-family HTH domain
VIETAEVGARKRDDNVPRDPKGKIRQVSLVGRKIRKLRKERKLTQTELASRIGVQQSDLSRMEKGEYRVSLDTLFRILAEFKLGIGEFFEDLTHESITPRDLQIMRHLKAMDEETRREVEDFIAFKRSQMTERSEQEKRNGS